MSIFINVVTFLQKEHQERKRYGTTKLDDVIKETKQAIELSIDYKNFFIQNPFAKLQDVPLQELPYQVN